MDFIFRRREGFFPNLENQEYECSKMKKNSGISSEDGRLGSIFRLLFMVACAAILSACAGYQAKTQNTMQAMRSGAIDAALADLESNNESKDKDLLYYLERGELLRLKGDLAGSRDTWLSADKIIQEWENTAKTDPSKLMGEIGSVLVNDTTRRYDGRDYEKVMLNLRLALDHLQLGDWESARTEIKKMHEREAVIAEFRSKDLEAAKKGAEEKGLKVTSFKDIEGYPAERLEDPAVVALKNSYESAIANYVAGFVYEALGEPSLASAGYLKAIAMRSSVPLLEQSLAGLEKRVADRGRSPGMVDTLIVVESGSAPSIESKMIPILLPIPGKNGLSILATPISWPVVNASDQNSFANGLHIDGQSHELAFLTSIDEMARRSIRDEMPGIITRSSIRAITRGIAQKAIDDNAGNAGAAGAVLSLFAKVASVATEQADERGWRTIPGAFSVARVSLPQGMHEFSVITAAGTHTKSVELSGPYAVLSMRVQSGSLYAAHTPYSPAVIAVPEPPLPVITAENEPPPPKKKSKKKTVKKAAAVSGENGPAKAKPPAAKQPGSSTSNATK